jgi:hypothetical protein
MNTLRARPLHWPLLLALFAPLALHLDSLSAEDTLAFPPELAPVAPNAAVVYWQAFSSMPTLNPDERKALDIVTTEPHRPPTEESKKLIEQHWRSLADLRRAGSIRVCDWNLDYSQGAELILPHLQKARDLCRVMLARASQRVAEGRIDDASDDIISVFQAARHCGSSPVLISLLVDVALETFATRVVARHLPRFSPAQAERFAARLEELPPASTFAACLRCEGVYFSDWIARKIHAQAKGGEAGLETLQLIGAFDPAAAILGGKDDEATATRNRLSKVGIDEVDRWLDRLRKDYAEIARISTSPLSERMKHFATFEANLADEKKRATEARFATPEQRDRLISMLMLPAVAKVGDKDARFQSRRELLRLALHARATGTNTWESGTSVGAGKVTHRSRGESGYELSILPAGTDTPEVLVVGEGDEPAKP